MSDLLGTVIFMTVVFGLAAGILWLIDRWTLPRGSSTEEKAAIVRRRSARLGKVWRRSFIAMALISLPLNWFVLITKKEPIFPTIIWIAVATVFLLGLLFPTKGVSRDE
jgi:hypothetical protein